MVVQTVESGRTISLSDMQYEYDTDFIKWSQFSNVAGTINTSASSFYGLQSNMILPVLRFDASSLSHLPIGTQINNTNPWINTGTWGPSYKFGIDIGTPPILGMSNGEYHVNFGTTTSMLTSTGTAWNFNWLSNSPTSIEGFTIIAVYKNIQASGSAWLLHMGSSNTVANANDLLFDAIDLRAMNYSQLNLYNRLTSLGGTAQYSYETYSDFNIVVNNAKNTAGGVITQIMVNYPTTSHSYRNQSVLTNRQMQNINTTLGAIKNSTGLTVNTNNFRGDLRDFMIFNKSLTRTEIYSWLTYLKNRWKLTIPEFYTPSMLSVDAYTLATTRTLVQNEPLTKMRMSSSNGNYPWNYTASPNCTTTPTINYTNSNIPYINFQYASNHSYIGENGQASFSINNLLDGVTHVFVGNLNQYAAGSLISFANTAGSRSQMHNVNLYGPGVTNEGRIFFHHRDGNSSDYGSYVDNGILRNTYHICVMQYDYDGVTKYIRAYRNDGVSVYRGPIGTLGPQSRTYTNAPTMSICSQWGSADYSGFHLHEYLYYNYTLASNEVWDLMKSLSAKWEMYMCPLILFDASTQAGASNTIATVWTNSGIGSNITMNPVNSPLIGTVGTYKHINFIASSTQYFNISGAYKLENIENNGFTITLVSRTATTALTYSTVFIGEDASQNDTIRLTRYGTSFEFVIKSGATQIINLSSAYGYSAINTWYIHIIVCQVNKSTIASATKLGVYLYRFPHQTAAYQNDPELAYSSIANSTTALSTRALWTLMRIASNLANDRNFNGDIRELGIYDYAMSTEQVRGTFNYLRSKWGM